MSERVQPTFDEVTVALQNLKALSEPAEAHALLCALFSAGADVRIHAWIDSMLSGHVEEGDIKAQEAFDVLEKLFNSTHEQYHSGYFDLELLLPGEEAPFYMRIGALALWCQGFISGLGLIGVDLAAQKNNEISEAVQDLSKMSRLQYDCEEEGNEDDEKAFFELVEYTKVAALLLHNEFAVKVESSDEA
ncbi:YecA family protein [Francisellaceae bacterium]|nr:YecA family protein [Francisellaceae bacterium]